MEVPYRFSRSFPLAKHHSDHVKKRLGTGSDHNALTKQVDSCFIVFAVTDQLITGG
ncbi:hypothetical protein DESC_40094 [Desulfosarcina cetonica]|nr:hypothetical protein DESC_40094 [Desulfosarcina cetonica]